MRTLQLVVMLLPLAALGCRVNPNIALVEQESRLLEDRVYELKWCLEDAHAAREAALRENESLKAQLAGEKGDSGPSLTAPADKPGRLRRPAKPKLEAPVIELPEPSDTPPVDLLPSGDTPSAAVDGQPTQLVIDLRATGGLDRDNQPGDEGILVAFEPRDAEGQLVKGPGAVSVVVLDPTLDGEAQRVARWDFAPEEVTGHFSTSPSRGVQFELSWPGQPPRNRDLRLFVRYTTPDGEKIVADAPLEYHGPRDAPALSRGPKNWSASESATRGRPAGAARRPAATRSRLKAREAPVRAARDADDQDEDEVAGEERPQRSARAKAPDRPSWKPFR